MFTVLIFINLLLGNDSYLLFLIFQTSSIGFIMPKYGCEKNKYMCKAVLFVLILKTQNTFLVLEKRLCLNDLVIPLAYNLYKRFEMSLR